MTRTKINNFLPQNSKKSIFQERISDFSSNLDPETEIKSTNDKLLQLFEKHVSEAAKEAAGRPITFKPDWFTASENEVDPQKERSAIGLHEKGSPDSPRDPKKS
jgi:hypothetical protein